jgi:hypothetical protein
MDQYTNYVKSLFAQGLTREAIYNDLTTKGFDPRLATWLVDTADPLAQQKAAAAGPAAPASPPSAVPGNTVGAIP